MPFSPSSEGMVPVMVAVAGVSACLVLAPWLPEWLRMPVGLVVGAVAIGGFHLSSQRRLARTAEAMREIENGNLGGSVPESGSTDLVEIARIVNGMTADFQEVLLLFAHLVRSARASTILLRDHLSNPKDRLDPENAEKVIADIEQMDEMIHDFKYFRVRLEADSIVDTGIDARLDAGAVSTSPNTGRNGQGGVGEGRPQ